MGGVNIENLARGTAATYRANQKAESGKKAGSEDESLSGTRKDNIRGRENDLCFWNKGGKPAWSRPSHCRGIRSSLPGSKQTDCIGSRLVIEKGKQEGDGDRSSGGM